MIEKLLEFFLDILLRWQTRDSLRTFGANRDPRWRQLVNEIKRERGAKCEVTGIVRDIEAHHIIPFHKRPDLELDKKNVILITRFLHLWLAHLGNFKSWNENILKDAEIWRNKINNRSN